jgi:tetratricopeptide (TPR) repeat protein
VTSRRRLTGLDQTRAVSLDVLDPPDSVALFRRIAGEERTVGASSAAVEQVVELCGRLPLAIRIAAARLRSRPAWTVEHLVEGLVDHRHGLAALDAGRRSVTAALDLSFRQLDPELRILYGLLGLHPGADFDRYAAAALAGSEPAPAARLIDELLEANLLQEPTPGRYRFHDLVRAHAGAIGVRDDAGSEGLKGITRLLDHYGGTTSVAMDIAYPSAPERRPRIGFATAGPALTDPVSAHAWLDAELSNLLAVALHAAAHGWPEHAVHLAVTLHRHFRSRGPYTDAERLYVRVLDVARRSGNRAGEADVLICLGEIRWPQGGLEPAAECYRLALAIARDLSHRTAEVDALVGLAEVMRSWGRSEQAVGLFGEAMDIARRTADRSGEMTVLIGLGWAELDLGRPAAEHLERALAIARAIGDPHEVARALRGLGHIHRLQGRRAQAADDFEQSLVVARTVGSPSAELGALIGLGMVCRLEGRHEEAGHAFERALTLAVDLGDLNQQFEAHHGLGRLRLSAGRADRAVDSHRAALDAAVALGQILDEARAHDGLARAHLALEQREQARRHWQAAADILTRLGLETTEDEEATLSAFRAHLRELPAETSNGRSDPAPG